MRPESLYPLFSPVTTLKGVGNRIAPLLERLAGPLVRDLLFLAPQSLVRREATEVATLRENEAQTLLVTIESHRKPARPAQPWKIRAFDATGFIHIVFFKAGGLDLERRHPRDARRAVSGKVEIDRFTGAPQIVHPDYFLPADRIAEIPAIEAVYPATAGLAPRAVRRLALEALKRAPSLPEWQDPAWLARQAWPSWLEAMQQLHNPHSDADLSPQAPQRRRLAFDELLAHQLALAQRKKARRAHPAPRFPISALSERALARLPFALTGAQRRARLEIAADLDSGQRMARLLQGDVGAGKTVVAMLATIDVAANGGQSALMAPTEILARQHFDTLGGPLAEQGVETLLLTGRDKGTARLDKLAALASGRCAVAVGTHALFQDEVIFADLRLAVIDEQHRFGVNERGRLMAKARSAHVLAMSATPIPRTLELTAFGDLDISRLDEKPPGRLPVATRAAPMPRLAEVIARLAKAVESGAQAFWICPLVSESEQVDLAAAEARARALREIFGDRVGLIHGRLMAGEKDLAMARFAAGDLAILVATTVVEVGVDVPAASIMIIEQAERFGLAQLHQLRGRVGRGARESSCILLYDPPLSEVAGRRLDVLRRTDDGFVIAEKDLELRGGGDPLGLRQSGFPAYRLADPIAHRDLIGPAADDAGLIMARDPTLQTPRGAALRTLQELFDWRATAAIREVG